MDFPDNLFYTKDHEWVLVEGNTATIGLTDYAQEQLGDIVFVDLPNKGQDLNKEETFGVVESVKSVSDCLMPMSGKITDINDSLANNPDVINEAPYDEGWMIKIELTKPEEKTSLLTPSAYETYVNEEL
ncbi:MAG: glycine cleavage system protein H [Deltaproteobacteria bacterium CG07_land_8_20_14_0_80_38_7]|nr:MAG: glycine cleavage system protein H [Deltaproteobacteria bacterium CG07_land_8_20_14_0_80_38_7]